MRFLPLLLLPLLLLPACRHRHLMAHEGAFAAAGYYFVPQGEGARPLSQGGKDGDLVGRIRSNGISVKVMPEKKGRYSRYSLWLWADGGAKGKAELSPRGDSFAVVCQDGSVSAMKEDPETLPGNWVCLLSLDGNICLMAWNRKNGGAHNPRFHVKVPRRTKQPDAVYKVFELDDPRYHHEGGALKELKMN